MTERMEQLGFKKAEISELDLDPFKMIGEKWMLITAGDEKASNTMTASWGGLGVIWSKPVAAVVIRPQRYTKEFVDSSDRFTLSFYPQDKKDALVYCGSHSGRDLQPNKKAENAGLTAMYHDGTVSYEQAELILVCKKLYETDILPECFEDMTLDKENYPQNDYHRVYIAQIISAYKK